MRMRFISVLVVLLAAAALSRSTGPRAHLVVSGHAASIISDHSGDGGDSRADDEQGRLIYERQRDGYVPPASRLAVNPQVAAAEDVAAKQGAIKQAVHVWTPLGPNPARSAPPFKFGTAAGRVLALAYAPVTKMLYLGSSGGGVWRSADGGLSWQPVTDTMPSLTNNALAVDPTNNHVIYAGTGEVTYCFGCLQGVGIYKSTNDGASWTDYGSQVLQGMAASAIRVDPIHPNYVYASMVGSWYSGVAVSTDAGHTWSIPQHNILYGKWITDLAIDNAGRLYAGVTNYGIATSIDHGTTWTWINGGPAPGSRLPGAQGDEYKISLVPSTAGSPPSRQILYAVTGYARSTNLYGQLLGIFRTTNGGATWTQIGTTASCYNYGGAWSHIYVAADPSDPTGNTAYVGLVHLCKTSNGLSAIPSWSNLSEPGAASYDGKEKMHVDQYAAAFAATTVGRVTTHTSYFANDGGVYKSTDGGATFTPLNSNLSITQFYAGAVGPASNPSLELAGAQDLGTIKYVGGAWIYGVGGDGFYTAIDPVNSLNQYSEYTYGQTYKSTDGFVNWQYADFGLTADPALWSAPLLMDPRSPATLYSGHNHLWVTKDGMNSWHMLGPTTGSNGLIAIAVAPKDPKHLYIADTWNGPNIWVPGDPNSIGHLWTSTDGGAHWMLRRLAACTASSPISPVCAGFHTSITSLAADPTNAQIIYATMSGTNPTTAIDKGQRYHVFRSADGGSTWKDISASLPNLPFQSIVVDPVKPTTVYAAAYIGVWVSTNSGTTWSLAGPGLPNAQVYQLAINSSGTQLTAFTYGRGAWHLSL